MRRLVMLTSAALSLLPLLAQPVAAKNEPATAMFTEVNVEYEGSKLWLPGTITVKKGTKVTIKLINNAPSGQHGFSIPAYNVAEIVDKGETKTVEFTADKAGIFPIICQLHPAHVGGQVVVQP